MEDTGPETVKLEHVHSECSHFTTLARHARHYPLSIIFLILFSLSAALYWVPSWIGVPTWCSRAATVLVNGRPLSSRCIAYSDLFDPMRDYFGNHSYPWSVSHWTSTQLFGVPLIEQLDYHMFNPVEWINWKASHELRSALLCAYLAFAGIGIVRFGRHWMNLQWSACLGGAIVYCAGSTVMFTFDYFSSVWALVCAPRILYYACEVLLSRPSRRAVWGLSIWISALLLGGQPQFTFMLAVVITGFVITILPFADGIARRVSVLVLIGVASVLLSAPQTMTMLRSQLKDKAFSVHSVHQPSHFLAVDCGWKTSWCNIAAIVIPWWRGPCRQSIAHSNESVGTPEDLPLSFGVLGTWLLAVGAISGMGSVFRRGFASDRQLVVRAATATTCCTILGCLVLQTFLTVNLWPFGFVNCNKYSTIALAMFGSMMISIGLDALAGIKWMTAGFAAGIVAVVPAAVSAWLFVNQRLLMVWDWDGFAHGLLSSTEPFCVALVAGIVLARFRMSINASMLASAGVLVLAGELICTANFGMAVQLEMMRIPVHVAFTLAAVYLLIDRHRYAFISASLGCIVFALWLGAVSTLVEQVENPDFTEHRPSLKSVMRARFQRCGYRERFLATFGLVSAVEASVDNMASLQARTPVVPITMQAILADFIRPSIMRDMKRSISVLDFQGVHGDPNDVSAEPYRLSWQEVFAARKYFNLYGVELLLDYRDGSLATLIKAHPELGKGLAAVELPEGLRERIVMFRDTQSLPRAFLSPSFSIAPMTDDAWYARKWMKGHCRELGQCQIVEYAEGQLPIFDGIAYTPHDGNTHGEIVPAQIEKDIDGCIVVRTKGTVAGVLTLNEQFHSGWRVKVDGSSRRTVRVNANVLGVMLETPGDHLVEFRFDSHTDDAVRLIPFGLLLTIVVAEAFRRYGSVTSKAHSEEACINLGSGISRMS